MKYAVSVPSVYLAGLFITDEFHLVQDICRRRYIGKGKAALLAISKGIADMKESTFTYFHTAHSCSKAFKHLFLCSHKTSSYDELASTRSTAFQVDAAAKIVRAPFLL